MFTICLSSVKETVRQTHRIGLLHQILCVKQEIGSDFIETSLGFSPDK